METEGTTTESERWAPPAHPAPWRLRAALAGAVVLVVVLAVAEAESGPRIDGGQRLQVVGSVAGGLVAVALLAGRYRGRVASGVLALLGAAVVAAGSGLGRPRSEVLTVAPDGLSGSARMVLETWWPVVALGLALVAAGVVLAGVERAPALGVDDRGRIRVVVGAGVALAGGLVAVAVVLREMAGYMFIAA